MILREINVNDLNRLLTEDQESDSIRKAIMLYMDRMGCTKKEAEKFVRIDLRQDLPNLRSKKGGKFILGVTRMFLERQLINADIIAQLDNTIRYVASDAHYNEYDKNLNGLKANELIERFSNAIMQDAENDKQRLGQNQYHKNNDYQIVAIEDFEMAKTYGKYTSWCVTHYEHMFNSYTNNGTAQFYFCLKNGFENIEAKPGENCPLDEYGLSMIAVCVDSKGMLKTSTCRWNHDNGGNDKILTTEQISEIIGENFYDIFKPNDSWGKFVENIKQSLARGDFKCFEDYTQLETNVYKVLAGDLYNIVVMNTNTNMYELVSDVWFDFIHSRPTTSGFYRCCKGQDMYFFSKKLKKMVQAEEGKQMVLNTVKELLDAEDYDEIVTVVDNSYSMYNGCTIIHILDGFNVIDDEHNLVFPTCHEDIVPFRHDKKLFYVVQDNGEEMLVDEQLNDVLQKKYKKIRTSIGIEDSIRVKDNEGWNIVLLSNPSETFCKKSFKKDCHYIGEKNGIRYCIGVNGDTDATNLYNKDGEALCKEMNFDEVTIIYNKYGIYVKKNHMMNILSFEGEILSDVWFNDMVTTYYVSEDVPFNIVTLGSKKTFFNLATRKFIEHLFDDVTEFGYYEQTTVKNDGLYNIINTEGDIMLDKWYVSIEAISYGSFIVTDENKQKNIVKDGKYKLKEWADDIVERNCYMYITYGDNLFKKNLLDILYIGEE